MNTLAITTVERRALRCLLRYREPGQTPHRRITPVMRADLLGWATTLPDESILHMRGVGKTLLAWIRDHQPVPTNTDTTCYLTDCPRCGGIVRGDRGPLAAPLDVREQAWAEYKRVTEAAFAEYEMIAAPARAEYKKVQAAAQAKYFALVGRP